MPVPFRVLIIDDSERDALLIARSLRQHWPTLVFDRLDGAPALREALEDQTWDCILCDMVMPSFRASAALEIVRSRAAQLPFIVVSGVISIEHAISLLKRGAHDFVRKDNLARLVPAIESSLREVEIRNKRDTAERNLKESEERFRGIFENSEVSIWNEDLSAVQAALKKLDIDNVEALRRYLESDDKQAARDLATQVKVVDVNGATLKLFGSSCKQSFLSRIRSTFGSGAMQVFIDELCAIWNGQSNFRGEAVFKALDGRKISAIIAFSIPKTDDGFRRVPVSIIDITERIEAEEALRNSEDKFSKAFHDHPTAMQIIDLETGERLDFNDRYCQISGYSREELFPVSIFESGLWINREEGKAGIKKLLTDGHIHDFPMEVVTKSGQTRKWLASGAVLDRDQVKHAVISFIDITERLQAREELRRLAMVVEQSLESIVITDLDAKIEYVNSAFERATGYSRDEVMGKNPRILHSGKTPRETYDRLWRALTRGQSWRGEFYNRTKDGSDYIELAKITPVRRMDGTITHYVALKEDITEKKLLAEELEQYRDHLEEEIKNRTAQLSEEQKKSEAANQAKSTFLANMSHEIRTPMNAIVGLINLLQHTAMTEEQSAHLNQIEASTQHLLSIINDILDLSKIEAGKLTLEQANFRLDAVFEHVQSLLIEQAKNKGLSIETDLRDVPIWLHGDPTRLRQALLNYVGNAIKFTKQGTIYLRAEKLQADEGGVLLRFEVQDTGIGIEPDKLSGLFEAFEQADASTTRKHGGTGLGLAITQHLAQLMGGEVGVESKPGRGSTFWFTARLGRGQGSLLAKPADDEADTEAHLQAHYAGSRVLLVEDHAINRMVAVELLSGAGLTVDTAEDGAEAVSMVSANAYDLILMDVQMPKMDGIEATRLIRSLPRSTATVDGVPILAMTANVFEEDRQACLAAGMDDFVAKPIDLKNLFSTLAKWLPERTSQGNN